MKIHVNRRLMSASRDALKGPVRIMLPTKHFTSTSEISWQRNQENKCWQYTGTLGSLRSMFNFILLQGSA